MCKELCNSDGCSAEFYQRIQDLVNKVESEFVGTNYIIHNETCYKTVYKLEEVSDT